MAIAGSIGKASVKTSWNDWSRDIPGRIEIVDIVSCDFYLDQADVSNISARNKFGHSDCDEAATSTSRDHSGCDLCAHIFLKSQSGNGNKE